MKPIAMTPFPIPGFRFFPNDEELIAFLSLKANGTLLPVEGLIKEIDFYSIYDPVKIFEGIEDKIVYAFSRMKEGNERRKIDWEISGNGRWKEVYKDGRRIYNGERKLVGEKMKYSFVDEKHRDLGYYMSVLALDEQSLRAAKHKSYAVFKFSTEDSDYEECSPKNAEAKQVEPHFSSPEDSDSGQPTGSKRRKLQ